MRFESLAIIVLFLSLGILLESCDADDDQIRKSIDSLASDVAAVRDRAIFDLVVTGSEAVPLLIETMRAGTISAQKGAAIALGKMGEKAAPSEEVLRDAINDATRDELVRSYAAWAVWKVTGDVDSALSVLIVSLKSQSLKTRSDAAAKIREMGVLVKGSVPDLLAALKIEINDYPLRNQLPFDQQFFDIQFNLKLAVRGLAEEAVPQLSESLKDTDPAFRGVVAQLLGEIGKSAASAAENLRTALAEAESQKERVFIADALWRTVEDSKTAIPVLTEALDPDNADAGGRIDAALILGTIGPPARPAVPLLKQTLQAADVRLQICSARSLWSLEAGGELIRPVLTSALESDDVFVVSHGVQLVKSMEGAAAPVVPQLIAKLSKSATSFLAADGLVAIGKPALPALVESLKSTQTVLRQRSAEVLGRIGPSAWLAVSALLKASSDGDADVRVAAMEAVSAIEAIDGSDANLVERLRDPDPEVRLLRLKKVKLESVPNEVIATIGELLNDPDPRVRKQCALLLAQNVEKAQSQHSALLSAAQDADTDVRVEVARALLRIESKDVRGLPAFAAALRQDNVNLKRELALHLSELGADAVPLLIAAADDADDQVVSNAAFSLGFIGSAASAAGDRLQTLLSHQNAEVQSAAIKALGKVKIRPQQIVPRLIALLDVAQDLQVQKAVAEAIGNYGADAVSATPTLLAALKSSTAPIELQRQLAFSILLINPPETAAGELCTILSAATDPTLQRYLCDSLARIGPPSIPALDKLKELAGNIELDDQTRSKAIDCLRSIGPTAKPALSTLFAVVKDKNRPALHFMAAFAILNIGIGAGEVKNVVTFLDHENPKVRALACQALGLLGPVANAATEPLLETFGKDGVADVRHSALICLATIAPESSDVRHVVLENLNDTDPAIRQAAAFALGRLSSLPKTCLPIIKSVLETTTEPLQVSYVLNSLEPFGADASDLVPVLIDILRREAQISRPVGLSLAGPAARVLGAIGPAAEKAIPDIWQLTDPKFSFLDRRAAVDALYQIGLDDAAYARNLIVFLNDDSAYVRTWAARSLADMGAADTSAIGPLTRSLADKVVSVQYWAAVALGGFGADASESADELHTLLSTSDTRLQSAAAISLGRIGHAARDSVPLLLNHLKSQSEQVRTEVCKALGSIRTESRRCIPELILRLKDKNETELVATAAIEALVRFGADAVEPLKEALRDQQNSTLRRRAAKALGKAGAVAVSAIGELKELLRDEVTVVRGHAAEALRAIVHALRQAPKIADAMTVIDVNSTFKQTHADYPASEAVTRALADDETFYRELLPPWSLVLLRKNVWFLSAAWIAAYIVLLIGTWSLLLCLRPLWLLFIGDMVQALEWKIPMPSSLGTVQLPARQALLLEPWFHHHPRVLDAWVAHYATTAFERYCEQSVVVERTPHIDSSPVRIDAKVLTTAEAKAKLQPLFTRSQFMLVIQGEGGAGKTSLACELGKAVLDSRLQGTMVSHLMLPVLIDQPFILHGDSSEGIVTALFKAVYGRLQALIPTLPPDQDELVRQLLATQRVLVIFDGVSEWPEISQNLIRPATLGWIARALVVTSRIEPQLDGIGRKVLTMEKLTGSTLAVFIDDLLQRIPQTNRAPWREAFTSEELLRASTQLSTIVGSDVCTAMLAKLFTKKMIELKEQQKSLSELPISTIALITDYTNDLCIKRPSSHGLDLTEVHADLRALGWGCVEERLHATSMQLSDAIKLLSSPDASARLSRLVNDLGVISIVGDLHDRIQFVLDPLAEYLAAQHVTSTFTGRGASQKWRGLRSRLEKALKEPGGLERTAGFRRALKEYIFEKEVVGLPEGLLDLLYL